MTSEAINQELMREPFLPIRVFVSDGHSYEIRNPGLCFIWRGTLYLARTDRPTRIADNMDAIDAAHVTRIEQTDEPATTHPNPPRQL
jgi:hypothetical protein